MSTIFTTIQTLLGDLGGFFTAINPNGILEDTLLLCAAVAALFFTPPPFSLSNTTTLLAIGGVSKAAISLFGALGVLKKPADKPAKAGSDASDETSA
jgi:hypothetical protein